MLRVRQQDAERQASLTRVVRQKARFPVLQQVAAARRDEAQKEQAQFRDVQAWLKLEPLVRLPQASQPRALRRSDESESLDDLLARQVPRGAQSLEPS
jgi:hypothetical protein